MALVLNIKHHQPTVQWEDIESKVQLFLKSQRFQQSLKQPLSKNLDSKAATLISLMWIRFCRTNEACDLREFNCICKAICDRLRNEPPPNHELQVLLDHYREMPSHLKLEAMRLIHAVDLRGQIFLDDAIRVLQMLLELIAEDDERKPFYEITYCNMLLCRYNIKSDLRDLRIASALAKILCTTAPEDKDHKSNAFMALALCKWEEARLSGEQTNRQVILADGSGELFIPSAAVYSAAELEHLSEGELVHIRGLQR